MKFYIGDKVKFKPWEKMKEEYGVDSMNNVKCTFYFTPEMRETVDFDKEYTVKSIYLKTNTNVNKKAFGVELEEATNTELDAFHISEDMLEKVDE